tara:strand:- start:1001 stop:1225 length:225 start_codon:yes stop_codon:yes gene_type:complete
MLNLSARVTVTRFHTSSANPNESKPGPRFAVEAGTVNSARWTGSKKLSWTLAIRELKPIFTFIYRRERRVDIYT